LQQPLAGPSGGTETKEKVNSTTRRREGLASGKGVAGRDQVVEEESFLGQRELLKAGKQN